jgi:hypothetical protein
VVHSRFRAVGHRKGGKQLLNTSAGLVRTVVRNEGVVNGDEERCADCSALNCPANRPLFGRLGQARVKSRSL